jgi:hypothetical protein
MMAGNPRQKAYMSRAGALEIEPMPWLGRPGEFVACLVAVVR